MLQQLEKRKIKTSLSIEYNRTAMSKSGTTALPTWSSVQRICFDSDVAASQAFVKVQQPTTVPIANLVTSLKSNLSGALIDVDSSYIVYGVKNGLVRVIDRNSAARTLLRGHEEPITDIAFFGKETGPHHSHVVATVGGVGGPSANVLIWQIIQNGVDDLTTEKLLEIKFPAADRMIWHPMNPNQFLLSHRISHDCENTCHAVATHVVTTHLTTGPHVTEGHAVCSAEGDVIAGMLQLVVGGLQNPNEAMIQDMCWSHKDNRHVLTAHKDGWIRLWDLQVRVMVSPNGDQISVDSKDKNNTLGAKVSAKCLFKVQAVKTSKNEGNASNNPRDYSLQRCMFLNSYDRTATDSETFFTPPFITCTNNGSTVSLWSPFSSTGLLPTQEKVFELVRQDTNQSYQNTICTVPHISTPLDITIAPPSTFLIFADELEGRIYALHMASSWSDKKKNDGTSSATVTGFDYIVPFQTVYPIYSLCAQSFSKDIELFCAQNKAIQMLTLNSSKFNLPPVLSETDSSLPPGVSCVNTSDKESVSKTTYDYEEFDDIDETQIDGSEKSNKESIDSYDNLVEPVDSSSEEVKSEDGDTFIESLPSTSYAEGVGIGAFSNWLGSLASMEKQGLVPPTPQVTPLVKGKVAEKSLLSGLRDLPQMSLPNIPGTNYDGDEQSKIFEPGQTQSLLSPMEFLRSSSSTKESKKQLQLPNSALSSMVADLPDNSTDNPKVMSVSKKAAKGTKLSSNEASLSKVDSKVTILKKEVDDVVKESLKPILSDTPEELDLVVRQAVAAQFKQQESSLAIEIQKSIRSEMQSSLIPSLTKTITQTVEQTVHKIISATVSDHIREASNAQVKDLIDAVKGQMKDSFYLSMRELMIPAFESATKEMFGQISKTLNSGISQNRGNDDLLTVVRHMADRMDSMSKTIEVLIETVNQMTVRQTVCDPNMASPTASESHQDIRRDILTLLNKKSYEAAFTKALSLSDAEFVLLVCKQSALSTVLEAETPLLSQPILLCLMQQLGTNIVNANSDDAKLILEWLQSIAIILNPLNEHIKKHIANVCAQVIENINRKLSSGDQSLRRPLQTLLQIIRGITNT